ncbi:permease prefix domain 1-containing protein [Umezawaea beigongshangensis]|uniref:permease prefix domain 1-containing protein n=1 Tax=Umezawaea beigongshangensis TaxID=2780383 RepID=UPI0018F1C64C|nr:permease prefix domain 1-containing protein [Umezawaea beigongshangensis]
MAGAGLIEEYVSALDRRLRGPGPVKRDLLAEARDSLHDAAESYRHRGLPESEAQARAVAEFGPLGVVAREYQGELAVAHGARTLRSLLLVVPLAHLLWEANRRFWIGAWQPFDQPPPDWYPLIATANDTTAWVVALCAVAALLAVRWMSRRGASGVALGRLAGAVAAAAVGTTVFCNLALVVATAHLDAQRLLASPPVLLATALSYVITLRCGVLAHRCLRFSAV